MIELFVSDPFILPWMQVDSGAVKYILSGANVMCPGLTSRGGAISQLEPNSPVVSSVTLNGKFHFYETSIRCFLICKTVESTYFWIFASFL